MKVSLNPEAQRFVESQVRSGTFSSADELVDEAVQRMKLETELELDDDTAAAINRAEEQIDRAQGIDFDQFAAQWRKKLAAG